jgi:dolichyl-diphosphooligosaccharide--protein glycosyltransferase
MNTKVLLSKSKPIIIIILLFIMAFALRADAVNINGVPQNYTSLFEDQNGQPYFSNNGTTKIPITNGIIPPT